MSRKMWALDQKYSKRTKLLRNALMQSWGQVYFVGICIFAKIIKRKKGYYYRVVLLLRPRLREGMLRK
jgi:hypothetical protein